VIDQTIGISSNKQSKKNRNVDMDVVPSFRKNKASEYARWWQLFNSYAMHKEFKEVLNVTKHYNLPEQEKFFDSNGDPDKATERKLTDENKEALTLNKMAILALVIAFKDNKNDDCMSMVYNSQTKEWPTGKCWEIVKDLRDEYRPVDDVLRAVLYQRNELAKIGMSYWDDPKTLFSQIAMIEKKERQSISSRAKNREPTLREIRTSMFDYCYRTEKKKPKGHRLEVASYTRRFDSSDSSGGWESQQRRDYSGKSVCRLDRSGRRTVTTVYL